MRMPMIGLDAALFREDCRGFTLHPATGAPTVFLRESEGHWRPESSPDHVVGDDEVRDLIQNQFGREGDRLVCELPAERVEFRATRCGVDIQRAVRAEQPLDAPQHVAAIQQLMEVLQITGASRKEKMKQALHFVGVVLNALPQKLPRQLRVLDLACGRSYLGFSLAYLLSQRGVDVRLHGVDRSAELIRTCTGLAAELLPQKATFEAADLEGYSAREPFDLLLCLHGCDVLSDEALRVGVQGGSRYMFVAPCCQHEVRHQWKTHALDWVARYGLLEQRLADVLTDGLRCLLLEALGYRVQVIRFAEPDVTPKNLLIQAVRGGGRSPDRLREVQAFLAGFGVRPRLVEALLPHPGA